MRWLLLKDLQILRRSPLQAFLLVAYPVLIAVLVGFAISRSPEKPRVAFLNEVPAELAGQRRHQRAAENRRQRPDLRAGRVRPRQGPRRSGGRGPLRRRAGGADPARRPGRPDQLALDAEPADARSRGDRQRGGPGQGAPGQRPDQLAAGPGQPGDRPPDRRRRGQIPRPRPQRRPVQRARPDDPDPRPGEQRPHPRSAAAGPAARAAARIGRPGDPVHHPRPRKPRHRRRRCSRAWRSR